MSAKERTITGLTSLVEIIARRTLHKDDLLPLIDNKGLKDKAIAEKLVKKLHFLTYLRMYNTTDLEYINTAILGVCSFHAIRPPAPHKLYRYKPLTSTRSSA